MFFRKKKTERLFNKNSDGIIFSRHMKGDNTPAFSVTTSKKIKSEFNKKLDLLKTFFVDHFHIVFKSAAHNHLRLIATKDKNIQFGSYSHLKKYQKKVRLFTFSASSVMVLFFGAALFFQFFLISNTRGASFGWIQTDWGSDVDTVNFPIHDNNQMDWTKMYSKQNVDISNQELKLERNRF